MENLIISDMPAAVLLLVGLLLLMIAFRGFGAMTMTMQSYAAILFIIFSFLNIPLSAAEPQSRPVLPEVISKRLLSEMQISVAATPHLGESMTLGFSLTYGTAYDPADKGGLANVVTQMIGRATIDKSSKDVQDELALLQSSMEARADWDGIRIFLRTNSANYERALLLLYQVIGEAQFNPEDLASLKQEMNQKLSIPEDPRQRIQGQFERALYRGTTYGRSLSGTQATLNNIAIGDVRLFYRKYFSPDAACLAVVGSVPAPLVLQKATRIWGVWVRKEETPFAFLPPRTPSSRNVYLEDDPASPAAQFIMGNLWPRREEPVFYPAMLAARILQERLTIALPTSLLSVKAEGRRLPGPFYIQGQSAADQASEQVEKILEVAENLKTAGVTPEEVSSAQARWIEEFNRNLSATEGVCAMMLDAELYRLGTNYAVSFSEQVKRYDADAIRDAAKNWVFPGGLIVLVRGPGSVIRPAMELHGSVQQLTP
jgi:zinc protease